MSEKLKELASNTTYELSLFDIENLIAETYGIDMNKMKIEYTYGEVGADPMDRHPGRKILTGMKIIVYR